MEEERAWTTSDDDVERKNDASEKRMFVSQRWTLLW